MSILGQSYHERLANRLALGARELPAPLTIQVADFLRKAQEADGGFHGREPGSDLYYTGFALRSLAILGQLNEPLCSRTAQFLLTQMGETLSLVDTFSLAYSGVLVALGGGPDIFASAPDWTETVVRRLLAHRNPDGGFAQKPGAKESSTYMSFLALLCFQILGKRWDDPASLIKFVNSREKNDGGFAEHRGMTKSGTNPTAAGLAILKILDPSILENKKEKLISLFLERAASEGGFRANASIPFCDTLSTFTALWSLEELGALNRVDSVAVRNFVLGQLSNEGGFGGGSWDSHRDVEYTFYALGALALLSAPLNP